MSDLHPEARFRSRHATTWTGYQVHLSETCEADNHQSTEIKGGVEAIGWIEKGT